MWDTFWIVVILYMVDGNFIIITALDLIHKSYYTTSYGENENRAHQQSILDVAEIVERLAKNQIGALIIISKPGWISRIGIKLIVCIDVFFHLVKYVTNQYHVNLALFLLGYLFMEHSVSLATDLLMRLFSNKLAHVKEIPDALHPESHLHDGAILVSGFDVFVNLKLKAPSKLVQFLNVIVQYTVPGQNKMSSNFGCRHSAAINESTKGSVAIIVSEERHSITISHLGKW
jgi:DNA integrity scanning protein DisA with diadenylate cyclase activity